MNVKQAVVQTCVAVGTAFGTAVMSTAALAESYLPAGVGATLVADAGDTAKAVTVEFFPVITVVALAMAALSWWGRGLGKAKIR